MRRRAKPAKAKVEGKPAGKSSKADDARVRDLEKRLAESLERENATGEILNVISRSPTDIQPVLDTVVGHAGRLCAARDAQIFRREGAVLRLVAHHGPIPTGVVGEFTMPLTRGTVNGRAVMEQRAIVVADLRAETAEFPEGSAISRNLGHRSVLSVPLMREGVAIGTLSVRRAEVLAFTDAQMALLQTFADQAVIAIENVRLFRELQEKHKALTEAHAQVAEALAQQTATSEILRVISQSQTDVQPVFNAIVQSGLRLLGGFSAGMMLLRDNDCLDLVAYTSIDEEADASLIHAFPLPLHHATSAATRAIHERRAHAVEDIESTRDVTDITREIGRARGWRSNLFVPMIRDDVVLGLISITRRDPGPFAADEISLLGTFADQAVIAIENVRLFTELQEKNRALTQAHAQVTESLEQQTATSEILKAISGAQTDINPVFDAIARSAVKLCGAFACRVFRAAGEQLPVVGEAYGTPDARALFHGTHSEAVGRDSPSGIAVRERRVVQYADVPNDPDVPERCRERARVRGYRALMAVPMVRDEVVLGTITVVRQEPVPFSEQQVELVKTFADQAVIAIENVRLFNELQEKNRALTQAHAQVTEALEQQTATSEILRVISSSPTDLQPVFDTIVASAVRLLGGYSGVLTRIAGDQVVLVAITSPNEADAAAVRAFFPRSLQSGGAHAQAIHDKTPFNIADFETDSRVPQSALKASRARGYRSLVAVPLLRHNEALGAIGVSRREAGGFTDEEIALLQTFADQAVIAIENVRLFKELEERNAELVESLLRQTTTGEILSVISRTRTDPQPVFDAIASSAAALCEADGGGVFLRLGDHVVRVARASTSGRLVDPSAPDPWREGPVPLGQTSVGQVIMTGTVLNVPDTEDQPNQGLRDAARATGFRSVLTVAMLRGTESIGGISVVRWRAGPFSDGQVQLLRTFADQAVIAIENVRLFKELEARTDELSRSVGELRALGEVGQAISSILDLDTVLTTIVSRAVQLSGLDGGVVFEYDEDAEEFTQRAAAETGGSLPRLGGGRGIERERECSGGRPLPWNQPKCRTLPCQAPMTAEYGRI